MFIVSLDVVVSSDSEFFAVFCVVFCYYNLSVTRLFDMMAEIQIRSKIRGY